MIRCRLPKSAMAAFGRVLHTFAQTRLRFIVRDRSAPQISQMMFMPHDAVSDLMYKSQWRMGLVEIKMPSLTNVTEFVLVLRNGEEFPISGFPRRLQEDDSLTCKWTCPRYILPLLITFHSNEIHKRHHQPLARPNDKQTS
jgi:hypothetical protein